MSHSHFCTLCCLLFKVNSAQNSPFSLHNNDLCPCAWAAIMPKCKHKWEKRAVCSVAFISFQIAWYLVPWQQTQFILSKAYLLWHCHCDICAAYIQMPLILCLLVFPLSWLPLSNTYLYCQCQPLRLPWSFTIFFPHIFCCSGINMFFCFGFTSCAYHYIVCVLSSVIQLGSSSAIALYRWYGISKNKPDHRTVHKYPQGKARGTMAHLVPKPAN